MWVEYHKMTQKKDNSEVKSSDENTDVLGSVIYSLFLLVFFFLCAEFSL